MAVLLILYILTGHYERAPYNDSDIRTIYHVREYDVHKLKQVEEPLDIFISHDWPRGITAFGNLKQLLRHKSFLESEVLIFKSLICKICLESRPPCLHKRKGNGPLRLYC